MSIYTKIIILFILWILTFLPIIKEMILSWISYHNNSYCILVPFISLYLLWQKKDILRNCKFRQSNIGLFIILFSLLIYLIAYAGHIAFICRCMLIICLVGIIIFNFGIDIFLQIRASILFLFFMIPVPVSFISMISFPLKLFVTKISAYILYLLGIPVYQEGNILNLCNAKIEIVEACSGLRFLISFIMIGAFFMFQLRKLIARSIILCSAIPIAILSNIIRIVCLGISVCIFGENILKGNPHEFLGILAFLFGMFIFIFEFLIIKVRFER